MELDELKKRLYEEGENIQDRPQPPEAFEPGHISLEPQEEAPEWSERDAKLPWRGLIKRRIFWFAGGTAVLVLAGAAAWFFMLGRDSFDKTKVALNIYGQERIVSGEDINYIVRFKNNTNAILENVVLEFTYPEQAFPGDTQEIRLQGNLPVSTKDLGQLAVGQEGQAEFKARVLGDKDSQQKFSAKLKYRPANISSDFINTADFTSTIISVPLVLNFDLPERIVSGQTINFSLKYLNTSDATFSDSRIQLEYPAGFTYEGAYPAPAEGDNIWILPEIGRQEEGRIVIKGTVSGSEGDSKIFRARVGIQKDDVFIAYAQALASPEISVSPLFVELALANQETLTADLGQTLNYIVKYRNTTAVAIGPVVITVKIDSQAIDLTSVSAQKGFFSSAGGIITWNASSLPELNSLEAREEGEVTFSLRIKDKLPVNNYSDKNFTILTGAEIDSPNVPLSLVGTQIKGANQLAIKINSRLTLNVKGFYSDNLMPNSGPLPPRVGQRTTYTIYLQLLNVSNDLTGVVVEGYLPPYIQWLDRIYPTGESLKYDSATGKISWKLDKLSAATGILSAVKYVAFQVAFIPSISQVGSNAEIISNAQASGFDTFTLNTITTASQTLKTDLPDDPTVGWEKGRVAQ
ncbi:hypothetical protein KJ853_02180 [Patescibacteria group bacterium]|nr:hypothetical protein [Patescibacteria group bacterium]